MTSQGVAFGASTPVPSGGDLMESVNVFEKSLARRVDVVNTFKKWGGPSGTFASVRPELDAVSRDGRVPMVTWEPMPATGSTNAFPVERIAAGDFDAYIDSWADGMRDFGKPVHLRPMHEMNGNWYSWSGNPAAYVAAWRHLHDTFVERGATNVQWDWVANADDAPTTNTMESYWPGAEYVDVLGLDGYNCYWKWRSFETSSSARTPASPRLTRTCLCGSSRPAAASRPQMSPSRPVTPRPSGSATRTPGRRSRACAR